MKQAPGLGGGNSLMFLYNSLSMDPKHQNKEVKESSNYSGKPFLRPANTKIFIDFLKKTFGILKIISKYIGHCTTAEAVCVCFCRDGRKFPLALGKLARFIH
jgi:hypothetical protein